MATSPPKPQGGRVDNTPTVQMVGVPPNVQQSLTPASGNHPLAELEAPPPLPGSAPVANPAFEMSLPGTNVSQVPCVQYSIQQHPQDPPTTVVSPNRSVSQHVSGPSHAATSPAQSLDDLVDVFLSGPSHRTQRGLSPLLRPPPLINEDPLQCLRTLVERRAWGDVLQVTADLLRGADSIYAPIYNSLLLPGAGAPEQNAPAQLKDETAEILALQCHAWLKLRRYTDLGQEVEKWNFLPYNENFNENEAPGWIPWSLCKLASRQRSFYPMLFLMYLCPSPRHCCYLVQISLLLRHCCILQTILTEDPTNCMQY